MLALRYVALPCLATCFAFSGCADETPIADLDAPGDADDSGGGAPEECAGIVTCDDAAGGAGGAGCEPTELSLEWSSFPLGSAGRVTDFVFLPGDSGKFLLTDASGKLFMGQVTKDGVTVPHVWSLPDTLVTEEACGLTNVALDPEFDATDGGFIYVSYCSTVTNTRVVRFTWSESAGLTDQAVVFETDLSKETDSWHRFGSMGFEPDGKTMWLLAGDHFRSRNGQNTEVPMGKLLRLVPSRKPGEGGASVPAGNLAENGDPDAHPFVFAYGLRSPWRGTRDDLGRIWIGDVGLGKAEEVNLATEVGQNFGWDVHEGPCSSDCEGFTDPLVSYSRATDHPYVLDDPDTSPATKRAIWVGQIYESKRVDPYCGLLDQTVFFGDLFTGWVRGLRANADGEVTFDRSLGHLENVTAFHQGPDGYGYFLTLDGQLHRALPRFGEE